MLTIGITTFKRRFELVESLIKKIKTFEPNIEIILTINADYKEAFDEEYRSKILLLASQTKNCFPIVFPSFTGLSKMWNSMILNSSNEFILVLNDDIELENQNIITLMEQELLGIKNNNNLESELFLINGSWSHFVASKKIIDELGYFDERLLAFGEEDGDMVWRYQNKYGKKIKAIKIDGITNIQEGYKIPHKNMQIEDVNKTRFVPRFNRNFIKEKYHKCLWGIKGMFDCRVKEVIPNLKQYPYEQFKRENYDKM